VGGFVGLFGDPAIPADDLDAAVSTIQHRGRDGWNIHTEPGYVVAGGVNRVTSESAGERQPWVGGAGVVVVFDGRLDERADLARALGLRATDQSDPALVEAAFSRFGERFVERLHGDFVVAVYDPKSQTLYLARDAVGVRPLVIWREGGRVAFACEAKAVLRLLGQGPLPNEDLLAETLLGGNARASRWDTFFAGISSVPPGVVVKVRNGVVTWRTFFRFEVPPRGSGGSFEATVEGFRDTFFRSVRRRLRTEGPPAVLVSGGLDSSSIFCTALDIARKEGLPEPVGFTWTFPEGSAGDEEYFVRAIEGAYDTQVIRVPMVHERLVAGSRRQAWIVEAPRLNESWAGLEAAWSAMHERGCRVQLSGLWGDQLMIDQSYLVDLFDRFRLADIRRHLAAYPLWMTDVDPGVFRRGLVKDLIRWHVPRSLIPSARRLNSRANGLRHDLPPVTDRLRATALGSARRTPIGGLSRTSVHGRSILGRVSSVQNVLGMASECTSAAAGGVESWLPMLDRDLISFLIAIPGEHMTPDGRSRGLLRDAMQRVVPDVILDRRSKGDGTAFSASALARQAQGIATVLSGDTVSARMGWVDSVTLRTRLPDLVRLVGDGDFGAGLELLDLLALESWADVFDLEP
jgi:asparagine synthase (glutamine-hydrolysing)